MKTYTKIEDFITEIVLHFDENPVINKIISKLNSLNDYGKIIIKDNVLMWENNDGKMIKSVEVDSLNKRIIVNEVSAKVQNKTTYNFVNKLEYKIVKGVTVSYNYEQCYDITSLDNYNTKINAKISKSYHYYDKDKFLGMSYDEEECYVLKDKNSNTINEERKEKSELIKVLATGDRIKLETIDGDNKYYIYSKNRQSPNSFTKEISKKDFYELISFSDNAYYLINHDTIYGLRGSSYN